MLVKYNFNTKEALAGIAFSFFLVSIRIAQILRNP